MTQIHSFSSWGNLREWNSAAKVMLWLTIRRNIWNIAGRSFDIFFTIFGDSRLNDPSETKIVVADKWKRVRISHSYTKLRSKNILNFYWSAEAIFLLYTTLKLLIINFSITQDNFVPYFELATSLLIISVFKLIKISIYWLFLSIKSNIAVIQFTDKICSTCPHFCSTLSIKYGKSFGFTEYIVTKYSSTSRNTDLCFI